MPISRVPNSPYWWYDFRFGGRRYRGSTKETSKAAAKHAEATLITQLRSGDKPATGAKPPTLRELLVKFQEFFDQHQQRKPKTKTYYKSGAVLLLNTTLRDLPIDHITTSRVACIAFPGSPSNGNCALRTLSKALAQAVEWGFIASKPRIHLFEEQGREATFTADYERRLLAVATQPLRDVFIILMDQGMRPEEVCRMRWEDVLWDRNSILVPKGKTKGSKRFIGMSPRVVDLLKERVRKQGEDAGIGIFLHRSGDRDNRKHDSNVRNSCSPWVFPSPKAKEGHIVTVNKAFVKARKAAGLPESLVLYSTRHTFGTDIMRATGNQKLVMVAMGHSDIKTSSRYQHPTTEGVGDIINERNQKRSEDRKEERVM